LSWRRAARPATDAERVIVVLSDLHLGLAAAPTPASLRPVLEGATEVILNGDAAESASPELSARGEDALSDLRGFVASMGAAWLRIEGNHDPASGDACAFRAGGRVLVTHGHAFHPAIAPWSPAAAKVSSEFRRAFDAAADMPQPHRTLVAARAAAIRERQHERAQSPMAILRGMAMRPWVFPLIIGYWRIFPELATRFLEIAGSASATEGGPDPQAIIAGHSHRPGAWLIRGKLVLNTGSFTFPGQPYAATIDDHEIALVPLIRTGGEWRQDAAGRRCWRIDDIARATASRSTPVV
jgi:predicted phosphodiesterase